MEQAQQNKLKQKVAEKALEFIVPNTYIGIGTGSTVNYLIDALAERKNTILGAVSSSEQSTERLVSAGIKVLDMKTIDKLSVYIDGADEVDQSLHLIKGGGGALTREKIIAALADQFVCIVDRTKVVNTLGTFPIPMEVIDMARNAISRYIANTYQARAVYRDGVITDNGHVILDIHDLDMSNPSLLELELNHIPGVVCHGIFAKHSADVLLVGEENDVIVKMKKQI